MLVRHLALVLWATIRYAASTRKVGVLLAIVLGLVLLSIALASQAAAPFVLYPFA